MVIHIVTKIELISPWAMTVRSITGCLPVSDRVKSFRLMFFGHLARSAPDEDHRRVIAAALRQPTDWMCLW